MNKHTPEPWEANSFSDINGNKHESNIAVAETLKYSVMQSESNELFGASQEDLVIFYTGNGPRSKFNAIRAVECVNACVGMDNPADEITAMHNAIKNINDVLDECIMVPANVLPAWNEIRKILMEIK